MRLHQSPGGDFEECPTGVWAARCYKIIDLGTQTASFKGETKLQRKVVITFEVYTNPPMEDGRPFSQSQWFTNSNFEGSNLVKFLTAWRGAPIDPNEMSDETFMEKLLGKPCMLSLSKSAPNTQGQTYVNIISCMRVPQGMQVPRLINKPVIFDLDNFNQQVFDSLTDKMKQKIAASPEYKMLTQAGFAGRQNVQQRGSQHGQQQSRQAQYGASRQAQSPQYQPGQAGYGAHGENINGPVYGMGSTQAGGPPRGGYSGPAGGPPDGPPLEDYENDSQREASYGQDRSDMDSDIPF
jgi:hypothetical protein